MVRTSVLQTKKVANKQAGENKGKKPAAGGPRPRTRKTLKRRPKREQPRQTLMSLRTRRPPRRKTRLIHVC